MQKRIGYKRVVILIAVFLMGVSLSSTYSKHAQVNITGDESMEDPSLRLSVLIYPRSTYLDHPAELKVRVYNEGNLTAKDVVISITLPSALYSPITSQEVGDLEGHASSTVTFDIAGSSTGTYTIQIRVSTSNAHEQTTTQDLTIIPLPDMFEGEENDESGVPGFEVIIVLVALPLLVWFRKRSH